MRHDHLFAFESDFVDRLQCIPMAVRFKLDRCGTKLTLKHWNQFTPADRRALLVAPCNTDREIKAYSDRLTRLVSLRSGGTPKSLPGPVDTTWARVDAPPSSVVAFAISKGLAAPAPEQWRALSELERFVLVKLSRDNHDNVNFVPALGEFGLLAELSVPDPDRDGRSDGCRHA